MRADYQKLIKEFEQLKTEISSPGLVGNSQKYRDTAKRYNELEKLAPALNRLAELERMIKEADDIILSDTDKELSEIARQELDDYGEEKLSLEQEIETKMAQPDENEDKNIIIEIRGGTGGDEAALFAAALFRMYSHFAEKQGGRVKIISSSPTSLGGFKEIIFEISGAGVYNWFKFESGTHRVQRIPDTEKAGRVHTSTATVAVMPEALESELVINTQDLKIDLFRAGGHGGQNVNKTETAIRITHLPTNIVVVCRDERSQAQNRAKAMTVLRTRILAAQKEKAANEQSEMRRKQVGTGDRAEKIRTYNYPQDRITDHRIKQSWHNIPKILDGELEPIINSLKIAEKELNK